jgi:hypothetical protein
MLILLSAEPEKFLLKCSQNISAHRRAPDTSHLPSGDLGSHELRDVGAMREAEQSPSHGPYTFIMSAQVSNMRELRPRKLLKLRVELEGSEVDNDSAVNCSAS